MDMTVAGAAAVIDYIFLVDRLPQPGQIKAILRSDGKNGNPYCGGGAPNIACGLAQLGHDVNLIYPVGEEFAGSVCEQRWRNLGIALDGVYAVPGEPSGFAYLFFQEDGSSMCFAYAGAAESATAPEVGDLAGTVIIAPVFNTFSKQVLETAIRQERTMILSGISYPHVAEYFEHIDTMIINSAEAADLCSALDIERADQLALRLKGRRLYVTHGTSGSVVYDGDNIARIPAVKPTRFVDPTGAGDAYTAGVVHGLARGLSPAVAGFVGATNASFVVQDLGGQTNLPTWENLKRRMLEQNPEVATQL